MAVNINIKSFQPAGMGAPVNALKESGGINQLMGHIKHTHVANDDVKLGIFMDCLSQALSSQGRYQGECESRIKNKIFKFSKEYPTAAQLVIQESRFKYNSKIKDTIDKVNYLSSSFCGSFYAAKVIHHLKDSYGNNKRYGVSYFTAGSSLILVGGILNIVSQPSGSSTEEKSHAAWGILTTGIAMAAFPLVNSLYLASQDEP